MDNGLELFKQCFIGNAQQRSIAGKAFYDKYYHKMKKAALNRNLKLQEAEEVFAIVFLELEKKYEKDALENIHPFEPYLWGIVQNKIIDLYNKSNKIQINRWTETESEWVEDLGQFSLLATSLEDTQKKMLDYMDEDMESFLNTVFDPPLKPQDKQFIQEFYLNGKKLKNIAIEQSKKEGTIRKQKSDLLEKLKKNFSFGHVLKMIYK
jgi:RNA polymerase sigma factor (sigma-70 family)